MRFKEFIIEGNLSHAELGKHYGRYLAMFMDKVNNGEPFEISNPKVKKELGDQVVIDPSGLPELLKAYFDKVEIPDASEISADSGGKIFPKSDPNKVPLKTETGATVYIGQLRKPPEFGSKKGFNTGQIAEGALGAALVARFIKREGSITSQDTMNIIKQLGSGNESGKNLQADITVTSANDVIKFNVVLPKGDYNALYGGVSGGKIHPDMQGVINSATKFANSNSVDVALDRIVRDPNKNTVVVNSDGASDQTGTKADLFLSIDGKNVNLLSLKAGDVKQFGQGSGFTYDKLDDFFRTTFGVNVPAQYEKELEGKDPKDAFRIIHEVYASVAKQIQDELAGNNDAQEARFVERLYKGINFHATRGDDGVTLVMLKKTPTAPGFTELQFGQPLRDAMESTDLQVEYSTPGQGSAVINVMGVAPNGAKQMLVRTRGNLKSEGKGYVRNIVEMGPLLKTLAKIERDQQNVGNNRTNGG